VLRWALGLPHVQWLQTLLPARKDSGAAMCVVVLDHTSLLKSAPVPSRVLWLWAQPPCQEGSGAATRLVVPCGSRATNIKKNLASMPTQLGSHVSKSRTHVSKAHDVRSIIGLQDVRTVYAFNACMVRGKTPTMWL
jgi:hypothetical protein